MCARVGGAQTPLTGVVVDAGHSGVSVVPVVEGYVMPGGAQRLSVGGAHLTALVHHLMEVGLPSPGPCNARSGDPGQPASAAQPVAGLQPQCLSGSAISRQRAAQPLAQAHDMLILGGGWWQARGVSPPAGEGALVARRIKERFCYTCSDAVKACTL